MMFDLNKEWSISFAGCGFMGIYYVGAASCIFERIPQFFHRASRIYGASAGCLMSTMLTIGVPLEQSCLELMSMAREARKRKLGPLHPAFNLLQIVRRSLVEMLPPDAHLRASGRLCVSLTRVADGKNVIVSQFDTRDELIQALICSCFIPFYCGIIPPTYRGVRYVDGAISDNLPRCHQRNTITFSAFAGESDVCPRGGAALSFHEVRFNNVSIHINAQNMYRVTSTFFPPEPEAMAEICNSGYLDALRFLQESGLVPGEVPLAGLALTAVCCELGNVDPSERPGSCEEEHHGWLKQQLVENLPLGIKRALCEACKEQCAGSSLLSQVKQLLPGNVASYLRIPSTLPVGKLANRLADWIPELPRDMGWLYGMAGHRHAAVESEEEDYHYADPPLRRCTSLPAILDTLQQSGEQFVYPLTPEATPTHNHAFTWDTGNIPVDQYHHDTQHLSLTPPPTPTLGGGSAASQAAGWSSGLGWAMGWFRHMGSEMVWSPKLPET